MGRSRKVCQQPREILTQSHEEQFATDAMRGTVSGKNLCLGRQLVPVPMILRKSREPTKNRTENRKICYTQKYVELLGCVYIVWEPELLWQGPY